MPLLTGSTRRASRARALEVLELVGLATELGGRYPVQLSGGQQQRVGVARALAADPPVLLMDEPFSAVDPVVREDLQDQLLRLQSELGKTILFVTHDIDEAIKLGDAVVVLRTAVCWRSSIRRSGCSTNPPTSSWPGSSDVTGGTGHCRSSPPPIYRCMSWTPCGSTKVGPERGGGWRWTPMAGRGAGSIQPGPTARCGPGDRCTAGAARCEPRWMRHCPRLQASAWSSTATAPRWVVCLPRMSSPCGAGNGVLMLAEIGDYLSSPSNRAKVFELLGDHVVLALLLLLIGLAMAVPLGWAGRRSGCAGCG